MTRGKAFAAMSLLIAVVTLGLSIYVLIACDFYQVTWIIPGTGRTRTESPGLFNCKYVPKTQLGNNSFRGPMNGLDMIPTIAGFMAAGLGLLAVIFLYMSHWKLPCGNNALRVRNIGLSSCLLMMAAIFQALTMLVLVGDACSPSYEGDCQLLTNAYISAAAAGGWFLASCFNREIVGRRASGSRNGNDLPK